MARSGKSPEHPDYWTPERRLLECEEALRSTEAEFAAFRERTLTPLNEQQARAGGDSIDSLSWDELLGVAVRNLNDALDLQRRLDAMTRARDLCKRQTAEAFENGKAAGRSAERARLAELDAERLAEALRITRDAMEQPFAQKLSAQSIASHALREHERVEDARAALSEGTPE